MAKQNKQYDPFYTILSSIKRVFSRSPTHREALNNAKCPRKRGPRGGARYRCECCRVDFGVTGVQVDHIDPVIPVDRRARDMSWDEIISRIFCAIENLQVACRSCHKKKTAIENKERRKHK